MRKHQNNIHHQEKESSKDSAYGFSGGETSRMGNPHTREPTPEEKTGDLGRYKRPHSRYSSSNARYRRYHKVRGNVDARKRHTSSSRSDDERVPERNKGQAIKKNLMQQQLRNRKCLNIPIIWIAIFVIILFSYTLQNFVSFIFHNKKTRK